MDFIMKEILLMNLAGQIYFADTDFNSFCFTAESVPISFLPNIELITNLKSLI